MARQYLLDTNICVFYMRGMFDMNKKNNLVMVTDNIDHFSRIRGLEIEDWKISYPK